MDNVFKNDKLINEKRRKKKTLFLIKHFFFHVYIQMSNKECSDDLYLYERFVKKYNKRECKEGIE
jgi:hypothetical protein